MPGKHLRISSQALLERDRERERGRERGKAAPVSESSGSSYGYSLCHYDGSKRFVCFLVKIENKNGRMVPI